MYRNYRIQSTPQKKNCTGKPTVVAVIDTGFGAGWDGERNIKLCKFGHRDFTNGATTDRFDTKDRVPIDYHGHGTHVASVIDAFGKAGNINYCIVVLKYFNVHDDGMVNLEHTISAINYAKSIKADFINYSGGGILASDGEKTAVKEYLDAGGQFVAAAGNDGINIDFFNFYPAQDDDRVVVVGSLYADEKTHAKSSNYGKRVNRWEVGMNLVSLNHTMSGTSQATSVATGKLLVEKKNTCK